MLAVNKSENLRKSWLPSQPPQTQVNCPDREAGLMDGVIGNYKFKFCGSAGHPNGPPQKTTLDCARALQGRKVLEHTYNLLQYIEDSATFTRDLNDCMIVR